MLREVGAPDSDYAMPNGHRLLTYTRTAGGQTVIHRNWTGQAMGATTQVAYCTWSYEVEDTTIVAYRYEGTACRSR
jgi:hypothetical protein